ncbi:MAG: hypothetical protein E6J34_05450 [Chloroflexi bacterium]|nr:MAG: hypothetical protein E6J34_05450 [Chloroflexota bacterium]
MNFIGMCPFKSVIDAKMATIAALHDKLSIAQRGDGIGEHVMFPVTFEEVDVLKSSLRLFLGQAPRMLPPSSELLTLIMRCDET